MATSPRASRRTAREKRTLCAMVAIYCRAHHGRASPPCPECAELIDYALARLDRCPLGETKPTCAHCAIHCYKPSMRERVRAVMRYAGPRMIWRHPILALGHLFDGWRKP